MVSDTSKPCYMVTWTRKDSSRFSVEFGIQQWLPAFKVFGLSVKDLEEVLREVSYCQY